MGRRSGFIKRGFRSSRFIMALLALALIANAAAGMISDGTVTLFLGKPCDVKFDEASNTTLVSCPIACMSVAVSSGPNPLVLTAPFACDFSTGFTGKKPAALVGSFLLSLGHPTSGAKGDDILLKIDGKETSLKVTTRVEMAGKQLLMTSIPRKVVEDMSRAKSISITADGIQNQVGGSDFAGFLRATSPDPPLYMTM